MVCVILEIYSDFKAYHILSFMSFASRALRSYFQWLVRWYQLLYDYIYIYRWMLCAILSLPLLRSIRCASLCSLRVRTVSRSRYVDYWVEICAQELYLYHMYMYLSSYNTASECVWSFVASLSSCVLYYEPLHGFIAHNVGSGSLM